MGVGGRGRHDNVAKGATVCSCGKTQDCAAFFGHFNKVQWRVWKMAKQKMAKQMGYRHLLCI